MPTEYLLARKDVLDIVSSVVEDHHPDLSEARIGILMRSLAPRSAGRRVMGKAKKVGPEQKAFLPHDFIIWFAQDVWDELNSLQRRALVDHELCHCSIEDEKVRMKPHDIEEFHVIFERYGFWWPMAEESKEVMQASLGIVGLEGRVEGVNPQAMTGDLWGDEEDFNEDDDPDDAYEDGADDKEREPSEEVGS